MPPAERGRILQRAAQGVLAQAERLAVVETIDNGKTLAEARSDIRATARVFEYYAGVADKLQGESIPLGQGYVSFTTPEPVGVTAHVVPWNYPSSTMVRGIAPALAAGCTVVVKPAEQTPMTALLLAQILHEAGLPLTVESARRFTTRHARCGTTFLMVVVIVSVAVFALVLPQVLPHNGTLVNVLASIVVSVPLMFPIAGFAYELQRLGARFADNLLAQVFLAPGFLVQRITTAEPTDDQVEIALVALQSALENERALSPAATPGVEPVVTRYPSFAAFAIEHDAL